MRRITTIAVSAAAVAALAVPAVGQARQGADDPAGHVRHANETTHRHGGDDRARGRDRSSDDGARHQRHQRHHRHHAHHADDHGRRHGGHGADD
jgi:hypothetical protein